MMRRPADTRNTRCQASQSVARRQWPRTADREDAAGWTIDDRQRTVTPAMTDGPRSKAQLFMRPCPPWRASWILGARLVCKCSDVLPPPFRGAARATRAMGTKCPRREPQLRCSHAARARRGRASGRWQSIPSATCSSTVPILSLACHEMEPPAQGSRRSGSLPQNASAHSSLVFSCFSFRSGHASRRDRWLNKNPRLTGNRGFPGNSGFLC